MTDKTMAFCHTRIDGPNDLHLYIDGNSKIAMNDDYNHPEPNAFSLLQEKDCSKRTSDCQAFCYENDENLYTPEAYGFYKHNSETIRQIVADPMLSEAWAKTMGAWIAEHCPQGFRWHTTGADVFSDSYATFIVNVCDHSQKVRHWIYIKSFSTVALLTKAVMQNLAVNISADCENYAQARNTADTFGLKVCYRSSDGIIPDDLNDRDAIIPDTRRNGTVEGKSWFASLSQKYKKMVCLTDFFGTSENNKCKTCKKCLK